MVGKIGDMVSAAVVIGATERAGSASTENTQSMNAENYTRAENASEVDLRKIEESNEADAAQDEEQDEEPMSEESVSLMTDELNELMSRINCNLHFKYHKEVNMLSVKMIDKGTGELIKEVPPEKMIKHMIKAQEWLGAFLDKKG